MRSALGLCLLASLSACSSLAPEYHPPSTSAPAHWQNESAAPAEPGWQVAQPSDAQAKGDWWKLFNDPVLNQLTQAALAHNPTLAQAQSRLDQAKAQTTMAQSELVPTVGMTAGTSRFGTSKDRPLSAYSTPNQHVTQNDFNSAFSASYEVDLNGRVHSQIDSAKALEVKSGADFENTQLLLTAQLASSYFSLRTLDADIALLSRSLQAQKKYIGLLEDRHQQGLTSGLELAQQKALTSVLETQLQSLQNQRSQFQSAIATLTGQPAPSFALAALPDSEAALPQAPTIPLSSPATVLERRPDVASAERAMAAANAQIGIARSAYYPSVTLGSLLGTDANKTPLLLSGPAALWSLGLSAGLTLFDGGRIDANVSSAKAVYQQTASAYQQTVLNAFEEVQDTVNTRNALAQNQTALKASAQSARMAFELTQARYERGAASHLEVLTNEQIWLGYERQLLQNQGQQLLNTVQLVKVLGGGW